MHRAFSLAPTAKTIGIDGICWARLRLRSAQTASADSPTRQRSTNSRANPINARVGCERFLQLERRNVFTIANDELFLRFHALALTAVKWLNIEKNYAWNSDDKESG
jgi:hypothetical protein